MNTSMISQLNDSLLLQGTHCNGFKDKNHHVRECTFKALSLGNCNRFHQTQLIDM
jgi:hypothetical protein